MDAILFRLRQWFCSRFFVCLASALAAVGVVLFFSVFLCSCAKTGTYVLFAQNAKHDSDMAHAITIRLPFQNQPDGAMIFCFSPSTQVYAKRLDDSHVHVRDPDGEERDLELPNDESPVGLVTYWPEKSAQTCGIAPPSPVGTHAYIMWGEFVLYMRRSGQDEMSYGIGLREDILRLHYPLTPADRALLHKYAVPDEVANRLY